MADRQPSVTEHRAPQVGEGTGDLARLKQKHDPVVLGVRSLVTVRSFFQAKASSRWSWGASG
jgi:hypothetical protein